MGAWDAPPAWDMTMSSTSSFLATCTFPIGWQRQQTAAVPSASTICCAQLRELSQPALILQCPAAFLP